jgi:AcrR family transcriptional regulator
MSILDTQSINRIERHKQLTKRRLMEAAATIVQQHGYAKLTIKAVTELADVGYGTFYVHFESKEALLWEVFHAGAEQMRMGVVERLNGYPSPLREFLSWVDYFESILSVREMFAAMFGPDGNPTLRGYYQQYVIDVVMKNIQEERYSRAPLYAGFPEDYMARFVAGTQLQLTDWLIAPSCPYSAREMATLLFRTIYHHAPPE